MFSIIRLVLFLWLFGNSGLVAQNYAVQSTLILNPPYTLSLPQYASDPSLLSVQLLNKDFATPVVEVYLQLKIEGPGIALETKMNFRSVKSFSLTAGVPLYLNGTDLSELFNVANLNFTGLNAARFMAGGSYLPEGFYRFRICALEYNRGLQVSNWGSASASILKHLPPIINFPIDKSYVSPSSPQFLQIQFTPRHTISAELLTKVRYRIRMVEVVPPDRNPNEAMQSTGLAFFETVIDQTNFMFGAGEPILVEGRAYAIQVQAIDVEGKNLFENNGNSQVVSFYYGAKCPVPQNLKVRKDDDSSLIVVWDAHADCRAYMVDYHPKGVKVSQSEMVFSNVFNTGRLLADNEYEVKVAGVCKENISEFNSILLTTGNQQSNYDKWAGNCGRLLPSFDLTNRTGLTSLKNGDTIKAADFKVKVISSNGGNGVFSGKGLVSLPFTGKVPLPCTFSNVFLNEDKRLIQGKISLIKEPFEFSNRTYTNIAKSWQNLFGKNWNRFATRIYEGKIDKVFKDADGDLTIESADGSRKVTKGANVVIRDVLGKTWYISAGGKVSEAEGPLTNPIVKNIETGEGMPSGLPPGMTKLFFTIDKSDAADAMEISQLTAGKVYDRMESADTVYNVAWKLAKAGENFQVNAKLVQGHKYIIPPDSIRFARSDGTLLPFKRDGEVFVITATGRLHRYADAIWAIANYRLDPKSPAERWILGKINIINVDIRNMNVVLIPVNEVGRETDVVKMKEGLDGLLGSYALNTSVRLDQPLIMGNYDAQKEQFEADKSFLNIGYGSRLSRFIDAYKTKNKFLGDNASNDTAYLFLLNLSSDNSEGFMGPGEQFGFMFLNNAKDPNLHSTAHELGHGVFRLEHTFGSDISGSGISQNLMDYSPPFGLLNYSQWVQIHDPEIKNGLFQNEDKGKYVNINNGSVFRELANKDHTLTFISYSGEYITLPGTVSNLKFSTLNRGYLVAEDGSSDVRKPADNVFPLGCLTAFETSGKKYMARSGSGYVTKDGEAYVSKYESKAHADGIMVYLTFENNSYKTNASKFSSRLKFKTETKTGDGPLLRSFSVIDFNPEDLNKNFETAIEPGKTSKKTIADIEGKFGVFGNDSISFAYNDTFYNASNFLVKMLSTEKSVNDYIYYFNLVNLKQNEYYSFVNCLIDRITKKAILITDQFLAARHAQKGESGPVIKYINESSGLMFSEVYKIQLKDFIGSASNGIEITENLSKARYEEWNGAKLFGHLKSRNYERCDFYALGLPERIYCINTLISDRDYWQANEVNLIELLLKSTPRFDELDMLKMGIMPDRFSWLFQLWIQRKDDDISGCFDIINEWVVTHYEKLEIVGSEKQIVANGIKTSPCRYKLSRNDFYIGIRENTKNLEVLNNAFSLTCNGILSENGIYYESIPGHVNLLLNGSIKFEQIYRIDDIRPQVSDINHPKKLSTIVNYEEFFNPFEMISVTMGGNYFALGLNAGQIMEMPAFMAMQLQENLKNQVSAEASKRLINNVVLFASVASAVYTGGASLDIATSLFWATATADNLINNYKTGIKSQAEWEANSAFFSEWDAFYTAAEFALNVEDFRAIGLTAMPKLGAHIHTIHAWNRFNKFVKGNKVIAKELNEIVDNLISDVGMGLKSETRTLTKLNNKAASVEILWKNLDDKNIIWANPNSIELSSAKTFANETGVTFYDAVLTDGFYVKLDLNDGRILLGSTDGTFYAFANIKDDLFASFKKSVLTVSDDVFKSKLSEFLTEHADRLKIISGVTVKSLTIAGKILNFSRTKVNTILGRFDPDMKKLFSELGNYKNVGLGENPGCINILNKPDHYFVDPKTGLSLTVKEWWERYNKAWIERVVSRGDNVYLATKPTFENLYDFAKDAPSIYALEVQLLIKLKVKPINVTLDEWNEASQAITTIFEKL